MTIANITIPSFLDTTLSLLAKIYNKKEVKKTVIISAKLKLSNTKSPKIVIGKPKTIQILKYSFQ